jgi:retron-type reverse transcriptase
MLNVVVVDVAQIQVYFANSQKRKKMYELSHHFQDTWVEKLPWVESIMEGHTSQMHGL